MRCTCLFAGAVAAMLSFDAFAVTEAGRHSLEPAAHYRISFSFHGATNTKGKVVNFNMPGFLLNSLELSGVKTCRFDRIVRTWMEIPLVV